MRTSWNVLFLVAILSISFSSTLLAQEPADNLVKTHADTHLYTARDYSKLLGTPGLSETLLKNHFTLYQGYVKNTNLLLETLRQLSLVGKSDTPEFSELKRRFGWEFNGMRLHELFFENLGSIEPFDKTGKIAGAMAQNFRGFEAWEREIKSMGKMRGIGWAVLYQDLTNNKLFNCWIEEHDAGHPAGCQPILVLDLFEHAYLTDYGLKKADYVDSLLKIIDWKVVESRLK